MKNLTSREIARINTYEKLWKIKTNSNKSTIIPLAIRKKENVIAKKEHIPFKERGKVLGLSNGRTGIISHVGETIKKREGSSTRTTKI